MLQPQTSQGCQDRQPEYPLPGMEEAKNEASTGEDNICD